MRSTTILSDAQHLRPEEAEVRAEQGVFDNNFKALRKEQKLTPHHPRSVALGQKTHILAIFFEGGGGEANNTRRPRIAICNATEVNRPANSNAKIICHWPFTHLKEK